MALRKNYK